MTEPGGLRVAHLTRDEFAAALARGCWLLLPFGAIEQHGPHLPLATDLIEAEHVCAAGAARAAGPRAPGPPARRRRRPRAGRPRRRAVRLPGSDPARGGAGGAGRPRGVDRDLDDAAIAEDAVRPDRIPNVPDRPRISRFRVLTHPEAEFPTGVRGDTTRVSRALGERTVEHVVAELARLLGGI